MYNEKFNVPLSAVERFLNSSRLRSNGQSSDSQRNLFYFPYFLRRTHVKIRKSGTKKHLIIPKKTSAYLLLSTKDLKFSDCFL